MAEPPLPLTALSEARRAQTTDREALAAIVRIAGGNFRVIYCLLIPVEHILKIKQMQTITKEVVEAARENLVPGQA